MIKFLLRSLLCLPAAAALAGAADVSARVTDPQSRPIPDAAVRMISKYDGDNRTLTTDSNGACHFTGVAPGQYFLVSEPQSRPIPDAAVRMISKYDGDNRTLTTDSNGACHFTGVAPGQYFLVSDAPGFDASAPQSVEVKSEGLKREGIVQVTISLGVEQVHSSVVVTASGTPQTTDEVSKAITVVDGDTINRRADQAVGDALLDVPGLRVEQLGGPGSTTYFKIRGLRNADTAVLVD